MPRTLEIAFPNFKISNFSGEGGWEGYAPRPPRGKGLYGPFTSHSLLLSLQWPLIAKVIEAPVEINLSQEPFPRKWCKSCSYPKD